MWTYLQRWQVVNSLYHLQRKRGGVRWVQEHDLCAWIWGTDMSTSFWDENNFLFKIRGRLCCFFFGVSNINDLYTKIRNIINECEDVNVNWILRAKQKGTVSDYLNLTTRGWEVYPYSHLLGIFFGNYYVKWITTLIIVYILTHYLNINIQPK